MVPFLRIPNSVLPLPLPLVGAATATSDMMGVLICCSIGLCVIVNVQRKVLPKLS